MSLNERVYHFTLPRFCLLFTCRPSTGDAIGFVDGTFCDSTTLPAMKIPFKAIFAVSAGRRIYLFYKMTPPYYCLIPRRRFRAIAAY